MKRSDTPEFESYCEGNLDQDTISYFLKHLDNYSAARNIKHKLKIILIELISNILVHSDTPYGSISIEHSNGDFVIKAINYTGAEKAERAILLVEEIRMKSDLRGHYLNLLSKVTPDNQVSLGLIEIFRLCEGRINISSSVMNNREAISFEIRLRDTA
jgi:hypothetical protein